MNATKTSVDPLGPGRSILPARHGPPRTARALWVERTAVLIAATAAMRWVVATATGLSDTEAYYASWARTPALSYYDHPPLVAWTAWIARHAAGSLGSAPAARIGPVLYAAALQALIYRLAARLFSPRAGFFAATVLACIPVFFFVGFLLNPEALLTPLWALFLLLLLDLRDHDQPYRPLALGATVGVAFLAKYTAVLAVPVTLLFVASSPRVRRWLRRPSFYLAGLVALSVASPVIVWNALRGWPSLHLHFSERMATGPGESPWQVLRRVGSAQLAYFHPIVLPALVGVLVYACARSRSDPRHRFVVIASLPVLAFLLTMMVRAGDSEPHWTMVGYLPLVVAAGGFLDESTGVLRRAAHGVHRVALLVSGLAASLYAVHVGSPVLATKLPHYDAASDPLNETLGWDQVRASIRAQASGLGPAAVVVGAHNVLCGHLQTALDERSSISRDAGTPPTALQSSSWTASAIPHSFTRPCPATCAPPPMCWRSTDRGCGRRSIDFGPAGSPASEARRERAEGGRASARRLATAATLGDPRGNDGDHRGLRRFRVSADASYAI
ncbi:MAG TPA: glycosyltransferase family 39 protein [Polyangiaceae bacterium]|nr:glycosyltransferase family 39 protein [Polyangiaceae bacterium]